MSDFECEILVPTSPETECLFGDLAALGYTLAITAHGDHVAVALHGPPVERTLDPSRFVDVVTVWGPTGQVGALLETLVLAGHRLVHAEVPT